MDRADTASVPPGHTSEKRTGGYSGRAHNNELFPLSGTNHVLVVYMLPRKFQVCVRPPPQSGSGCTYDIGRYL